MFSLLQTMENVINKHIATCINICVLLLAVPFHFQVINVGCISYNAKFECGHQCFVVGKFSAIKYSQYYI